MSIHVRDTQPSTQPARAGRDLSALTTGLAWTLTAMVLAASVAGLFVEGVYGGAESTAAMLRGYDLVALVLVTQHFKPDELVDVTGRQGGLIELHAELLHPDSGYADHMNPSKESDSIVCGRARSTIFARKSGYLATVTVVTIPVSF